MFPAHNWYFPFTDLDGRWWCYSKVCLWLCTGHFKCSHAAALEIFAMWEISSTDVECNWRKVGTSRVIRPVSELYPQREESYNPLARDITSVWHGMAVVTWATATAGTSGYFQCAWAGEEAWGSGPWCNSRFNATDQGQAGYHPDRHHETAAETLVAVAQAGQLNSQWFRSRAAVKTLLHSMPFPHEEGAWGIHPRWSHGCQLECCQRDWRGEGFEAGLPGGGSRVWALC